MLIDEYNRLCLANGWHHDSVQLRAIETLSNITNTKLNLVDRLTSLLRPKVSDSNIYLHGGVGRGKTSIMDLFFSHLPKHIHKKRYHFNEFMQYIHDELFKAGKTKGSQKPIELVVKKLAKINVLCLDDLEITEIGDAMIIYRLFDKMIHAGITIVLTSNCTPVDLYKNGLHYERFEPFVGLVKDNFKIISFDGESSQDYRRIQNSTHGADEQTYFTPLNKSNEFHEIVKLLWGDNEPEALKLYHHGRCLEIPKVVETGDISVAYFTFAELCEQPLAANDYQKIAQSFNTLCLNGIPYFNDKNKDETRRFIKLIDTVYDNNMQFLCLASDHPDKLYQSHGLPFARTASRLVEMGGL